MNRLLAACLALLLSACAGTARQEGEPASYRIPPGSYFTLLKALEIPREDTTVHIQYGKPLPSYEVEEWSPHCFFELYSRSEEPRRVEPDKFEIQRVNKEVSPLWVSRPVMMAYGGESSGPSHLYYRTRYYLSSTNQPDVWRLSCQVDRMEAHGPSYDKWLTIDQVRETLAEFFILTLPNEAPGQTDD